MRRSLRLIVAVACTAMPLAATAQQPAPLTLRDAIAISLEKNPEKKLALADVQLAAARARLARTALLPKLFFHEGVTRGDDPVYAFGARLRQQQFSEGDFALNALNRPTPVNNFTTGFSGSWTVFDSWRTERKIHAADLHSRSALASSARSDQVIVRNTIQAYEAVLFANRQSEHSAHNLATAQSLEASSAARVDAGFAVDADRIAADAYVAERQQDQIEADGEVQIAWAELEAATGAVIPEDRRQLLPLAERALPSTGLDEAVALGLRSRPDREALAIQRDADNTAVAAAKSGFGPQLSSIGSWETDRASIAGAGGSNWVAGVELRMEILPAAQRQELAIAKIDARRADAASDSAGQRIRLEVTRAFYGLTAARQSLIVAKASSQQTDEGLRIAKDRYEAGLTTMTDLLRTEDQQRQSQTNYWQSVYRCALSYIDLQFATGTLTADTAGDLQ